MAQWNINQIKTLIINSSDFPGYEPDSIEVNLQQPIQDATYFKVRKVIFPNVIYQFISGINDCFYIVFQTEPDFVIKVPIPTNQVIFSFDEFAVFLQQALLAVDDSDSWSVVYNYQKNVLQFTNGSSRAFKILTKTDLEYLSQDGTTVINFNIGIDDSVNTYQLPNQGFATSQSIVGRPQINPSEVYINSSFCNNTLVALPDGNSRRQCILLLPLSKGYGAFTIYNSKADDWLVMSESLLSHFTISITDRYGRNIGVGMPYTIQLDFRYD